MANQSQKKIQKDSQWKMQAITFLVVLSHSACFGADFYYGRFFSFGTALRNLALVCVSCATRSAIARGFALGMKSDSFSVYLDLLAINVVAQLGQLLSDKFWYAYLLVPGWLLCKLAAFLWAKLSNIQYEAAAPETQEKGKKAQKARHAGK